MIICMIDDSEKTSYGMHADSVTIFWCHCNVGCTLLSRDSLPSSSQSLMLCAGWALVRTIWKCESILQVSQSVMISRTLCSRTWDPKSSTCKNCKDGWGQGLETGDKDLRRSLRPSSKQITSKRSYHNDTLPSTGVTVRFCTFWMSLVASYYGNSPSMQKNIR